MGKGDRSKPKNFEAELRFLAAMPDDEVDTSDIPEINDWRQAARGKFYRRDDSVRPDRLQNSGSR